MFYHGQLRRFNNLLYSDLTDNVLLQLLVAVSQSSHGTWQR